MKRFIEQEATEKAEEIKIKVGEGEGGDGGGGEWGKHRGVVAYRIVYGSLLCRDKAISLDC